MSKEWLNKILEEEILILDGAMGTELQKMGLSAGEAPELLNIKDPDMIKKVHESYIDAGSNIIEANTFGGNRYKLDEFGATDKIKEINTQGVKIAKDAAKGTQVKVFASMSSTGKFIEPVGEYPFDDIYDAFKEQAIILEKAGADGILVETMTDIKEMKAAVIAIKTNTDLPIMASMTFQENGRTVTGTDPKTAAIILDSLDVDVIGVNCSLGPKKLYEFLEEMIEVTDKPLFVQPNAGLPKLVDDKTVFDATPEFMCDYSEKFYELGINVIGGCCGASPKHLKMISDKLKSSPRKKRKKNQKITYLASRSAYEKIGSSEMVKILGEKINPNASKKIKENIQKYRTTEIRKKALSQVDNGASVLDINVGLGTIDEAKMMKKAIMAVENVVNVPVAIDTTDIKALEEGLKACSGKPLINSVMGKEKSMEKVFPLAKKYGAAVLGLTLDESGIPRKAEDRYEVAKKIMKKGMEYGIKKEDILIDALVLTASAEQDKALETVKTIRLIKENLGLNTVLGVSNISFGLPNRSYINSTFISMCIGAGLDLPIMNPMDTRMKQSIMAGCVLTNRDKKSSNYILFSSKEGDNGEDKAQLEDKNLTLEEEVENIILKGNSEDIVPNLKTLMKKMEPLDIINKILIPSITKVGELYDKGTYFLPQLIASANTMEKGVNMLKENMDEDDSNSLGKVAFATVKNDIHDIGKNIVVVLLENNGFEVIDLGKDVDTETIINTIKDENLDIIGLSALMTTTMVEMKKTIHKIKNENLDVEIMVGGAVVTPEFAKEEGVYYSTDAVDAVRVAKKAIQKREGK